MNRRKFIKDSLAIASISPLIASLGTDPKPVPPLRSEHLPIGYGGLVRPLTVDLTGEWDFREDPKEEGEDTQWFALGTVRGRKIVVPSSWQVVFDDLRSYSASAWYEREFVLPPSFAGKRIVAVFEAVSWNSKIWVNGQLAAEHDGGYLPFTADLTGFALPGKNNVMTLKASDLGDGADLSGSYDSFMKFSGIWRRAWIEARGRSYVSDVSVTPDIESASAAIRLTIFTAEADKANSLKLRLVVAAPDGSEVFAGTRPCPAPSGESHTVTLEVTSPIHSPRLWDPDHPNLYTIRVTMLGDAGELDTVETAFGMRKIDTNGSQLRLNGSPVYLRSGLDYIDYPNRNLYLQSYQPWSDTEIAAEIKRWKQLGFNCIREFGIADPRYLYWADRLGMLISEEPGTTCSKTTATARERWQELIKGMITRDRNHPSIIIWTLHNEDNALGPVGPDAVKFLKEDFDLAKSLDGSRPIIDNSGGLAIIQTDNIDGNHPVSDIDDIHYYYGLGPEFYPHSKTYLSSLQSRKRPLLITEMLALTYLPDVEAVKRDNGGTIPWWFYLPYLSGGPKDMLDKESAFGYEERFHEWDFDHIFGGFRQFSEANQWRNFQILKYEIEQIRKNPDVGGYTYTQMNQQPGDGVVGILGEFGFGKERVFAAEMPIVNNPDQILLDWSRLNYWSGETFRTDVYVSHFGPGPIKNARVQWALEGSDVHGQFGGVSVAQGKVQRVGEIEFQVPSTEKGVSRKLTVSVSGSDGQISSNYMAVNIFPADFMRARKGVTLVFYHPQAAGTADPLLLMASRLGVGGYQVVEMDHKPSVIVATTFDSKIQQQLNDGGTVLLVLNDPARIRADLGLAFGENNYYFQNGGWPCFIDKTFKLFERIPFDNPIGWPFYRVFSRLAIAGLSPKSRSDIIGAGYGPWWLRTEFLCGEKTIQGGLGANIARFNYGKGRLLITSFRILDPFLEDPVATILLQDLIGYCMTPFRASTTLPAPQG